MFANGTMESVRKIELLRMEDWKYKEGSCLSPLYDSMQYLRR